MAGMVIKGKGLLIFAGSERACSRKFSELLGVVYVTIKKLTKTESKEYWNRYINGVYYPSGYPPLPEYGAFLERAEDIKTWNRMNDY